MEKVCGNCDYWEPSQGGHIHGLCLKIEHDDGVSPPPDLEAYVVDQEMYSASLYTKSTFGCTLFEPFIEEKTE